MHLTGTTTTTGKKGLIMLLELLGGTAFRLLAGRFLDAWEAKSRHKQEMEFLELRSKLEDSASARRMNEAVKYKEIGITELRVQGDIKVDELELNGWLSTVKSIGDTINKTLDAPPVGKWWIDMWPKLVGVWNAAIRPALATIAIWCWLQSMWITNFNLNEFDKSLISGVLGIFIGERIRQQELRSKRGEV